MNNFLRIAFVAGALSIAAGSVSGQVTRSMGPESTLSIHLYDQAQVPAGVLHSATLEATRLFRTVGVQLTWEQHPIEISETRKIEIRNERSARLRSFNERPYLVLRLVRRTPTTVYPGALGFALPWARSGAQVSLFYDRVEALSWSISIAPSLILGYSMAHEIGHVLLGSSEHSGGGLMQEHWDRASWYAAAKGWLAFHPEEAERLGAGLKRFQARYPLPEHESVLASSAARRSPQ